VWGEAPVAVVVTESDADLSQADLVSWCRDRLAGYKCPRVVVFAERLPRTATTGKLDRRGARALAADLAKSS
jgi:fatty-acyl-CoA synthase